jgi:hypothetical protein
MERLVTVTTVRLDHEAEIVKACLAVNGIRCVIKGNAAASVAGAHNTITADWSNPLGGIQVQVAASNFEAAQEWLRSVDEAATPRRKKRSPLAEWIAHIESGLGGCPYPCASS